MNQQRREQLEPTSQEMEEFLDLAIEHARKIANGSDSLAPHLLVRCKSAPDAEPELVVAYLDVPFNEAKDKQAIMYRLGQQMFQDKRYVRGVCLFSEAWAAPEADCAPRDNPARKEVVIVMAQSLGKKINLSASMNITRDRKRTIQCGEPERFDKSGSPLLHHFWLGYFSKLLNTN